MGHAVIVEAARTPIGRRRGALAGLHPAELLGPRSSGVLERAGVDPADIGQIIGGCVTQAGEQSNNVTRKPGCTPDCRTRTAAPRIDCACGSVPAGGAPDRRADRRRVRSHAGIGCGVEAMSRVFLGQANAPGTGNPYPDDWTIDMGDQFTSAAADRRAAWHHARRRRRVRSRVAAARRPGVGRRSLRPRDRARHRARRRPRTDATGEIVVGHPRRRPARDDAEALAGLKPVIEGHIHTAGNSSQISDGAAAVLLMSRERAQALGPASPARGSSPPAWSDPIPTTTWTGRSSRPSMVLDRAGMTLGDIDLVEINEAFASVVLSWAQVHDADMSKVNVNGGAIALGHPVGSTGARLITEALHELERSRHLDRADHDVRRRCSLDRHHHRTHLTA